MPLVELKFLLQLHHLRLLLHQLIHEPLDVLDVDPHYLIRIFGGVLGGDLLPVFFRSGIGVVGPDVSALVVLSSQPKGRLVGRAFLVHFVLFGESLGLEVAVGFLERTKDGDIVGVGLNPPGLILLLIGLQLHRVLLLLRLLVGRLPVRLHLTFVFPHPPDRQLDMLDGSILDQLNIDRGSVGFVYSA